MISTELQKKLEKIAYDKTIPFCYQCYKNAPTGTCSTCSSDDLMRLLPGVGNEYGVDWVIEHLIEENLTPVNITEIFEDMISECYEETTQVGFMTLNTIDIMKDQDPTCWTIAQNEYVDSLVEDNQLVTFDNGSTHYWIHDIENFIRNNEL